MTTMIDPYTLPARLRSRSERTSFLHGFDRARENGPGGGLFSAAEYYAIPFRDGSALTGLLRPDADPRSAALLMERLEEFSGVPEAMQVMADVLEAYDETAPWGLTAWVDSDEFTLDAGSSLAATFPDYLANLTAAEIKQVSDALTGFTRACRSAALAYMRFCATHLWLAEWPDGEDEEPVYSTVADDIGSQDLLRVIIAD